MKKYTIIIFLFFVVMMSFSQDITSDTVSTSGENIQMTQNPKTFSSSALRLLQRAKQEFSALNYDQAYSVSELALTYDETIADFYYLQALSLQKSGKKSFEVIPLLEKSLQSQWYDYSPDEARLMLAKYYVEVSMPSLALTLLDVPTALVSLDASLIKSQANYILGNTDIARQLVLDGVHQYPLDTRFDTLFFEYEYDYVRESLQDYTNTTENSVLVSEDFIPSEEYIIDTDSAIDSNFINENDFGVSDEPEVSFEFLEIAPFVMQSDSQLFNTLAQTFIDRATSYENTHMLALLYAAIYSNSIEQKTRLLRAWNATGKKHPLYAIHALESDLISEQSAYDYMLGFFEHITYENLIDFISLIQSSDVKNQINSYFTTYDGTVLFDTNNDTYNEMIVSYDRGRPSVVEYDENQDGKLTWVVDADYAEPRTIELVEENVFIDYDVWPKLKSIELIGNNTTYYLINNTFSWTPIDMIKDDFFSEHLSYSFYIPVLTNASGMINALELFNNSYAIEMATKEYQNSKARYTLLDGIIKNIEYTQNSVPYAYASFSDGNLLSRRVDRDNDGYYESVEIYSKTELPSEDDIEYINTVFGFDHVFLGYYLEKVLIDLDKDGVDDFSHEYILDGGDVLTWDNNADGNWEIQFIQDPNGFEQTINYVHPLSNQIVTIQLQDGIPVFSNGKAVTKDAVYDFYWIGDNAGSSYAENIIKDLSDLNSSDIALIASDLFWNNERQQYMRIIGIRNGDKYFGEVFYE